MPLLKNIAYILMVCVALIVGGAIFLANYVNPNDYKPQISEQVLEKTGRTLVINGNISWSFFPWLGVVVKDAQLSNGAGFGKQPFAKIQEVAIEVKVLPLLRKKIEVGSLKLTGLELQLIKNAQGVTNWQDLQILAAPVAATPTKIETTPTETTPKQSFTFSISKVDISNAKIVWNDQQKDEKIIIRDLEIHSKNIQPDKTFPVSLSLASDINKLAATLKAEGTIDNAAQTVKISSFTTSIANLTATGQLQITSFETPTVQGQVQIPDFNPRQFLQAMKQKAPAPYDAAALKVASASFNLRASAAGIGLENLKARLDDSHITGSLKIHDKNLTLQATLDQIQIDRYMESKEKPAKLAISNVQATATGKLGDAFTANGNVKIGAIQAGELHATAFNAPVTVNNGLINLDAVTAQFYQGKYNGNIQIDTRTPVTKLTSKQTLTGIQLEPLLNDLKALTHLKATGIANIDTQLTASGKDTDSMTRSLNGQVKFAVQNGVLTGVDIDHTVTTFMDTMDTVFRNIKSPSELFSALKEKADPAIHGGTNQTKFDTATGTINIANGIAQNNDLLLKTAAITVTGTGSANLVNQTIDYRLNASKINPKTNKPYDEILPILVTGPLTNPNTRIDPNFINQLIQQEIAKQAKKHLADKVTEQAKKHLGDQVGGQIGEQLKNLNLDKLFK